MCSVGPCGTFWLRKRGSQTKSQLCAEQSSKARHIQDISRTYPRLSSLTLPTCIWKVNLEVSKAQRAVNKQKHKTPKENSHHTIVSCMVPHAMTKISRTQRELQQVYWLALVSFLSPCIPVRPSLLPPPQPTVDFVPSPFSPKHTGRNGIFNMYFIFDYLLVIKLLERYFWWDLEGLWERALFIDPPTRKKKNKKNGYLRIHATKKKERINLPGYVRVEPQPIKTEDQLILKWDGRSLEKGLCLRGTPSNFFHKLFTFPFGG